MPSPTHPVASVRGCARLCVNPAFPAVTDAPSRTVAHTQTALLPPYPRAVRELPARVARKWLAPDQGDPRRLRLRDTVRRRGARSPLARRQGTHGRRRQVVEMLQEDDQPPQVLVLQHVREGGHRREPDAVAPDGEYLAVGVGGVLPRRRTEELRRRRIERRREDVLLDVGCPVAAGAVVAIEQRGRGEVLRSCRDGALPFGCRALDGGVAGEACEPG